jgi:thiamine-monophosphate kinase
MQRLNRPKPRVELGLALRNIATSAIDISDGLVADLNHILAANQLGATIQLADLPLSAALQQWPREQAWSLALSAGDDYELCFTVPESCEIALQSHLKAIHSTCTCIGQIKKEPDFSILCHSIFYRSVLRKFCQEMSIILKSDAIHPLHLKTQFASSTTSGILAF